MVKCWVLPAAGLFSLERLIRSLLKCKPADCSTNTHLHTSFINYYEVTECAPVPFTFLFTIARTFHSWQIMLSLHLFSLVSDTPEQRHHDTLQHCVRASPAFIRGLISFNLNHVSSTQWDWFHTTRNRFNSVMQLHEMQLNVLYLLKSEMTWSTKPIVTIYLVMFSLSLQMRIKRIFYFFFLKVMFFLVVWIWSWLTEHFNRFSYLVSC